MKLQNDRKAGFVIYIRDEIGSVCGSEISTLCCVCREEFHARPNDFARRETCTKSEPAEKAQVQRLYRFKKKREMLLTSFSEGL